METTRFQRNGTLNHDIVAYSHLRSCLVFDWVSVLLLHPEEYFFEESVVSFNLSLHVQPWLPIFGFLLNAGAGNSRRSSLPRSGINLTVKTKH